MRLIDKEGEITFINITGEKVFKVEDAKKYKRKGWIKKILDKFR